MQSLIFESVPDLTQIYVRKAVVVRVIDGDSLVVNIDLGYDTWLFNENCRLYGIDCPEMRGEERPEGIIAKQYVEQLFVEEGMEIVVRSIQDKKGKFGRYLLVVWTAGMRSKSLNKRLLDEGLAVPYREK